MGLFDFFPYTSGHTLNLDWIIKQVKGFSSALTAHVDDKNNPHKVTAEQVGALSGIESAEYPDCYYRISGGGVEWFNPPLLAGIEYRTTERWNGQTVYTKLIDCGKMPNNTQMAIPHGINMDKAIRFCGYGGSSIIPYSTTMWNPAAVTHTIDVAVSTYAIYIRANYDASDENAMVQIWYTKTERV